MDLLALTPYIIECVDVIYTKAEGLTTKTNRCGYLTSISIEPHRLLCLRNTILIEMPSECAMHLVNAILSSTKCSYRTVKRATYYTENCISMQKLLQQFQSKCHTAPETCTLMRAQHTASRSPPYISIHQSKRRLLEFCSVYLLGSISLEILRFQTLIRNISCFICLQIILNTFLLI